MSDHNKTSRPTYTAYQVKSDSEDRSHFTKIGAAFSHKDGKGYTVTLDALPVDGKVVLRTARERLNSQKQKRDGKSQDIERD